VLEEEREMNLWPLVGRWRDDYHFLTVTRHFAASKESLKTKSKQTKNRYETRFKVSNSNVVRVLEETQKLKTSSCRSPHTNINLIIYLL